MLKEELAKEVRDFVKRNELSEAIELLFASKYSTEAITFSRRINELQIQIQNGEISYEKVSIEKNKIAKSILRIADTIENTDNYQESLKKTFNSNLLLVIPFIISILIAWKVLLTRNIGRVTIQEDNSGLNTETKDTSISKKVVVFNDVDTLKVKTKKKRIVKRVLMEGEIFLLKKGIANVNVYTMKGDSIETDDFGFFSLKLEEEKYSQRFYIYYKKDSFEGKKLVGKGQRNIRISLDENEIK